MEPYFQDVTKKAGSQPYLITVSEILYAKIRLAPLTNHHDDDDHARKERILFSNTK
jgi:hypothetical protein